MSKKTQGIFKKSGAVFPVSQLFWLFTPTTLLQPERPLSANLEKMLIL